MYKKVHRPNSRRLRYNTNRPRNSIIRDDCVLSFLRSCEDDPRVGGPADGSFEPSPLRQETDADASYQTPNTSSE